MYVTLKETQVGLYDTEHYMTNARVNMSHLSALDFRGSKFSPNKALYKCSVYFISSKLCILRYCIPIVQIANALVM